MDEEVNTTQETIELTTPSNVYDFAPQPYITVQDIAAIWMAAKLAIDERIYNGLPETTKTHFTIRG